MYVCMYVCMHVCMYVCMYVYIYIKWFLAVAYATPFLWNHLPTDIRSVYKNMSF